MQFETTAAGICEIVGGEVLGDPGTRVTGVGCVGDADEGDVILAQGSKYLKLALASKAACIVCEAGIAIDRDGKTLIAVERPEEAFARVLEMFRGEEPLPEVGIGAGAVIEHGVKLGAAVRIGANCYVGRGAELGDGCALFPNVFVGDRVRIGRESKLHPGVTIYWGCSVGSRSVLHAGVVIGADGFGYRPCASGLMKLPHAGTVTIGDDVEIGANSAIDRAKTGATVIGDGTKIDNLVHIAHNVKIGRHCVIVALSGIAGSVEIGDRVTLAAQTGIKDHVRIEDGAVVAARSGVIGDVDKGITVSGFPAREHKLEMRAQAARLRLPDILERLRALEREMRSLREGDVKDGRDI